MVTLAQSCVGGSPIRISLNPHRPLIGKHSFSLASVTLAKSSSPPSRFRSIRASSSLPNTPFELETRQNPKLSILKTTLVTVTTAAAVFFARFHCRPAIAALPPPSTTEERIENDGVSIEQLERDLEQQLVSNPDDVEVLRSLMEVRIKSNKLQQAIEVLDRLIEIEPEEREWPVLKAQMQTYGGDYDSAKNAFEEILAQDPLRVDAYHGLVMSYAESGLEMKQLEERINEAMNRCKKEDKNKDFRDFKLLIAQMKIIEGNPSDALKVYQELVEEEPRDFRPYLCQGLIYTLLEEKDEAERHFEQFRKLVPENHPYREYIADNLLSAQKIFSESFKE